MKIAGLALILSFAFEVAHAQFFAFHKNDSVIVTDNADTLQYAWGGGLNYGQFSSIDMDYDGDKDLFVFDRTGNRVIAFENSGAPGKIGYKVADRFRAGFPSLSDWALLTDYDGDGKEDIFTYYSGGVRVYRNTGDAANGVGFTQVRSQLYTDYNPGNAILFISLADIPAITDVDGDTDTDILTFSSNGGCVEFHRNLSVELYGHNDSLVYKRVSDNWGNFTEGATASDIVLSDSCDTLGSAPGGRHSGSSLLAIDTDGDGDKDLVLGDIGGPKLTFLRNDGSASYASMGAVDFNFPQNNTSTLPVNLTIFPAPFYVDVDNDGKRDLIVAPNSPGSSETFAGTWRYHNDGTDALPDFKLQQNDFIQKEMIEVGEGSYPRFTDYDRDGLMDLVIGNNSYWTTQGQLCLYRNTGTPTQPAFELVTRDLGNVSAQNYKNIIPAFGDMDADGDDDMIIGEVTGYIHYFENTAPVLPNTAANFALTATQYFGIKENSFSAPFIIDLDQDGKKDIVCGGRLGKLNYYRNTGSASSPAFSSVTTIAGLGGVNVVDPVISNSGYSVPEFFTHNGKTGLFTGSLKGTIWHYADIYDAAGNINATFTLQTDKAGDIWDGTRTGVTVYDLDSDSYPDLVAGNYSGGVALYYGEFTTMSGDPVGTPADLYLYPNPASGIVRIAGNFSLPLKLDITDISGRTVTTVQAYQPGQPVDMTAWEDGFYIFAFYHQQKLIATFKVIKTK